MSKHQGKLGRVPAAQDKPPREGREEGASEPSGLEEAGAPNMRSQQILITCLDGRVLREVKSLA